MNTVSSRHLLDPSADRGSTYCRGFEGNGDLTTDPSHANCKECLLVAATRGNHLAGKRLEELAPSKPATATRHLIDLDAGQFVTHCRCREANDSLTADPAQANCRGCLTVAATAGSPWAAKRLQELALPEVAPPPPIVRRGDVLFTLGMEIQHAGNDLRELTAFREKVDKYTRSAIVANEIGCPMLSVHGAAIMDGYTRANAEIRAAVGLPRIERPTWVDHHGLAAGAMAPSETSVGSVCASVAGPGDEQNAPPPPAPARKIKRVPVAGDVVMLRGTLAVTVERVDDRGRIDVAYFVDNEVHRQFSLPPYDWSYPEAR